MTSSEARSESKAVAMRPLLHRGVELEFLPAALEVLETPASPVGRATGATIIIFFAATVAWATFGHIDIITTAQGKIVPTGRTKTIQPLELGIVRAVHVDDGDHLTEGQILIELDQTVTRAERARTAHDLMMAKLDVARLAALRAGINSGGGFGDFDPPADAPVREVRRTRDAMVSQAQQQAAKVATIDEQIAQTIAEHDETQATIAKLEASLPLVDEEATVRRKAEELAYGNQIAWLEAQTKLVEQQQELVVQRHHLSTLLAARQALERQRDEATAQYAHDVLSDLGDAEQKSTELTQDLIKAERKMDERALRAPVDGTVQQLAVHTIGGVVTPAQQLMMIVPADSHLGAEAMAVTVEIKTGSCRVVEYLLSPLLRYSQESLRER